MLSELNGFFAGFFTTIQRGCTSFTSGVLTVTVQSNSQSNEEFQSIRIFLEIKRHVPRFATRNGCKTLTKIT